MKITWNTDVNAPCCPGEIVAEDGRSILVQQDTDFPGVASTFGWSPAYMLVGNAGCEHRSTDGTIDCPDCGMPAIRFIESAREFLDENDGAEVDDPGYFS